LSRIFANSSTAYSKTLVFSSLWARHKHARNFNLNSLRIHPQIFLICVSCDHKRRVAMHSLKEDKNAVCFFSDYTSPPQISTCMLNCNVETDCHCKLFLGFFLVFPFSKLLVNCSISLLSHKQDGILLYVSYLSRLNVDVSFLPINHKKTCLYIAN
jgi:hypothetical protein